MENNKEQNDKIIGNVLEKINAGQIKMHPKVYFTLKVVLLAAVSVLTLIVSSILLSYIFFSMRVSGRLFLLGFGFEGVKIFLIFFPWFMLLFEIILIIVLDKLLKYFKFGYHYPFVYLAAGTLILTACTGYFINSTPLHKRLLFQAEHRNLPVVGSFYSHLRRPPRDGGMFRGTVKSISEKSFEIQTEDKEDIVKVNVYNNRNLNNFIKIGDKVFVAGKLVNGEVRAFGIRKITDD
jgi:hypothetical protein